MRRKTIECLSRRGAEDFALNLAVSLNNSAKGLLSVGQFEQALAKADEAVRTLAPLFIEKPDEYRRLTQSVVRNYIDCCDRMHKIPDSDLLTPIEKLF